MKSKIKNIVIANDAEAFKSIINSIDDRVQRKAKIQKEHFLSSRFLFWAADNKVVISPFPIERTIITQTESIGYRNIQSWHPDRINISLSNAILNDKILLNDLVKAIKSNLGVTLSPYSYTKDFSTLVVFLRKRRLKFNVDQEPVKDAEALVKYLGSKVGFRIEMQKLQTKEQDLPIPEFFISEDLDMIIEKAVCFYKVKRSSVIKAFSGEGGWGVLMVRHTNYRSEADLRRKLILNFKRDAIWKSGPFVFEEFISSNRNDQNSPSLEVFANDKGFNITYICNQILDHSGRFIGILMGHDCINEDIAFKIRRIGRTIARKYHELGYRGHFDIDFIVSKNGTPYPIETNARRTGGTHVFDMTKRLFGRNWFNKTVALSADYFHYGNVVLPAEVLSSRMSEILFPIKSSREGIVLVAVDKNQAVFSYVIFASSQKRAMQIHKRLTLIWNRSILNK